MPGRNDFAIIRAGLLADARAHAAADAYITAGLAAEPTALATVVGHVAMLAVWASRDTDDGILPGDGVIAVSTALFLPRNQGRQVIELLVGAQLLRRQKRGVYIVGFRDCYSGIFEKRKADRERAAQDRKNKALAAKRSRDDVAATSQDSSADVDAESRRTGAVAVPRPLPEQNRTPAVPNARAAEGANGGGEPSHPPNGNGVAPSERAGVLAACGALIAAKDLAPDVRTEAKRIEQATRTGQATIEQLRDFVNRVVWTREPIRIAYLAARKP